MLDSGYIIMTEQIKSDDTDVIVTHTKIRISTQ